MPRNKSKDEELRAQLAEGRRRAQTEDKDLSDPDDLDDDDPADADDSDSDSAETDDDPLDEADADDGAGDGDDDDGEAEEVGAVNTDDDIVAKMRATLGSAAAGGSRLAAFVQQPVKTIGPLADNDPGTMPLPDQDHQDLGMHTPQSKPARARTRGRARREPQAMSTSPTTPQPTVDQALAHLRELNSDVTLRLLRRDPVTGRTTSVGYWDRRPLEDVYSAEGWVPAWSGGGSYIMQVSEPTAKHKVLTTRTFDLPGDQIDPLDVRNRTAAAQAAAVQGATMPQQPPQNTVVLPPGSVVFGPGQQPAPQSAAPPAADPDWRPAGPHRWFPPPRRDDDENAIAKVLEKVLDSKLGNNAERDRDAERREFDKRIEDERRRWEERMGEERKAREDAERKWQQQREEDRRALEAREREDRERRQTEENARHQEELRRERERREEEMKRQHEQHAAEVKRIEAELATKLAAEKALAESKQSEIMAKFDKFEEERRRREDEMKRREDELKRQHEQTLAAVEKKQAEDRFAQMLQEMRTQNTQLIEKFTTGNKVDPALTMMTAQNSETFKLLAALLGRDDGKGEIMRALLEVMSPERALASVQGVTDMAMKSNEFMVTLLKSGLAEQLGGNAAPNSPWPGVIERLVDSLGSVGEAVLTARQQIPQQQAAAAHVARTALLPGAPQPPRLPVPGPRPGAAAFGTPPAAPPIRLPEPVPVMPSAPPAPAPIAPPVPAASEPVEAGPAPVQPAVASEAAVPLLRIREALATNQPPDLVAKLLVEYVSFLYNFDMLPPPVEKAIFETPEQAVPQLLVTAIQLAPAPAVTLAPEYVSEVVRLFIERLEARLQADAPEAEADSDAADAAADADGTDTPDDEAAAADAANNGAEGAAVAAAPPVPAPVPPLRPVR